MGVPRLSQTARSYAPGSRQAFLVGLVLCLVFGCWCATQYTAYRLGFHQALGAPAFLLPDKLDVFARGGLALCLGAGVTFLFLSERRRFSPALLLAGGVLYVLVRWPVYGPIQYFLWTRAFGDDAVFADVASDARLLLAGGTFLALMASTPIARYRAMRRPSGSFGTAQ